MDSLAALWPRFEAASRDPAAWPALAAALHPVLAGMARHQPIGRLRASEDSAAEIVTGVLERLHARDLTAVKKLCAAEPRPTLEAWLRVVVRRAAIDYMRESPEYQRRDARWISLATLSSRVESGGPDSVVRMRTEVRAHLTAAMAEATAAIAAHGAEAAIDTLALAWAVSRTHARRFVQRHAQYLAVFDAVMTGATYPEVAAALGLTRREVELTVQYLEELLAARGFSAPV